MHVYRKNRDRTHLSTSCHSGIRLDLRSLKPLALQTGCAKMFRVCALGGRQGKNVMPNVFRLPATNTVLNPNRRLAGEKRTISIITIISSTSKLRLKDISVPFYWRILTRTNYFSCPYGYTNFVSQLARHRLFI